MRSILFDFGGTLDADGISWLERFRPLYAEEGIDVPRERFDRAFYASDDALPLRAELRGLDLEQTSRLQVAEVLKALAPRRADLAERIARRFVAGCRRHFSRLKPALRRLTAHYRLGIVSNFYGNLDGVLRAEGLGELFSVVADSGVLGVAKPDPAIFLHAADALGSRPAECLMVGDSASRDVAGAAAAGMKKALVCPAAPAPDAGQDWTIPSVAGLEAVLA